MRSLLIKITSRERPEKFFNAVDNIIRLIGNCQYSLEAVLDLDDTSMNNDLVKDRLREDYEIVVHWGLSQNKIHAYNRGVSKGDWDVVVATSDDMRFIEKDFGEIIIDLFEKNPNTGLLHLPDGRQNSLLVTLPIISREYYEIDKFIYNPLYQTQYADKEQMQVAKQRGKYQYVNKKLFHHDYPKGKEPKDKLYQRNEKPELKLADKTKYLDRAKTNFA